MAEKTPEQIAAEAAAQSAAVKPLRRKYRVLRPLQWGSKVYPVDGIIGLTEDEAQEYVMHQVLTIATEEVPL